ncbi:adenosine deaminase [Tepidibacter mesophilus]|uniref:adenosine deaminase n=1 Tax=Tepidibacter mesophilus TaxID=655607 RepID=UPI000C06C9D5|nr:adenosine deaminase [Tepidibacter mesophilus]
MNLNKTPKIELHCHLDGSVRPSTILDIANKDNIDIPTYDINEIKKYITAPKECRSLDEYLATFDISNKVMQTKENIKRITYELLEDVSKYNVKYIEMRFAPLFHMANGLKFDEIVQSVLDGINECENKFNVRANVILCCMRHMSADDAIFVIEEGKKFLGKGVVAVDLAGSENLYFPEKFKEAFDLAKSYGYNITIHAGETGIGENVFKSIEMLHAQRIGHGVFAKDCAKSYQMLKDMGVTLEMCPTSNVQTKAVNAYEEHPIKDFLDDDIRISINTDNMTVSDIDLDREFEILSRIKNLTEEDFKRIYLYSVDASFASDEVKEKLRKYVE